MIVGEKKSTLEISSELCWNERYEILPNFDKQT